MRQCRCWNTAENMWGPLQSDQTITEGDLLWGIKNQYNLNLKAAEDVPVSVIRRRADYQPVSGKSRMEDLIDRALNQNFVPAVDDRGLFIGIITRKDIIKYYAGTDRNGA